MKKSIIILILIVSFSSCKKVDFRDQYVGEYCCDNGDCFPVAKFDENSYVNIQFFRNPSYGKVYLSENGRFYNYGSHTLEGYFKGDSLFYIFAYNHDPIPTTYTKCVKK